MNGLKLLIYSLCLSMIASALSAAEVQTFLRFDSRDSILHHLSALYKTPETRDLPVTLQLRLDTLSLDDSPGSQDVFLDPMLTPQAQAFLAVLNTKAMVEFGIQWTQEIEGQIPQQYRIGFQDSTLVLITGTPENLLSVFSFTAGWSTGQFWSLDLEIRDRANINQWITGHLSDEDEHQMLQTILDRIESDRQGQNPCHKALTQPN